MTTKWLNMNYPKFLTTYRLEELGVTNATKTPTPKGVELYDNILLYVNDTIVFWQTLQNSMYLLVPLYPDRGSGQGL